MIDKSTLDQEKFHNLLNQNKDEKFQALSGLGSCLFFFIGLSVFELDLLFKKDFVGVLLFGMGDIFFAFGVLLYTGFTVGYYCSSFTKRWNIIKKTSYGTAILDLQKHIFNLTSDTVSDVLNTQNDLWREAHYKLGLVNINVPVPEFLKETDVKEQKKDEALAAAELYRNVLLQNPEQTIVDKSLKELNG